MGKRKYQFNNRAEAEQAYQQTERERHAVTYVLAELMISKPRLKRFGDYRIGLIGIDRPFGGYVLQSFEPKGCNQRPQVSVLPVYNWKTQTIHLSNHIGDRVETDTLIRMVEYVVAAEYEARKAIVAH